MAPTRVGFNASELAAHMDAKSFVIPLLGFQAIGLENEGFEQVLLDDILHAAGRNSNITLVIRANILGISHEHDPPLLSSDVDAARSVVFNLLKELPNSKLVVYVCGHEGDGCLDECAGNLTFMAEQLQDVCNGTKLTAEECSARVSIQCDESSALLQQTTDKSCVRRMAACPIVRSHCDSPHVARSLLQTLAMLNGIDHLPLEKVLTYVVGNDPKYVAVLEKWLKSVVSKSGIRCVSFEHDAHQPKQTEYDEGSDSDCSDDVVNSPAMKTFYGYEGSHQSHPVDNKHHSHQSQPVDYRHRSHQSHPVDHKHHSRHSHPSHHLTDESEHQPTTYPRRSEEHVDKHNRHKENPFSRKSRNTSPRRSADFFRRHPEDAFRRHPEDAFRRHPEDASRPRSEDAFRRHPEDASRPRSDAISQDASRRHPEDAFRRHSEDASRPRSDAISHHSRAPFSPPDSAPDSEHHQKIDSQPQPPVRLSEMAMGR